jgi:DNA-binding MarR family transcriptional regulator
MRPREPYTGHMAGIQRRVPAKTSSGHDHVDRLLADWARERPDLDTSPTAVVGRLGRLCAFLDAGLEALFARHGISRADFDVLATLRRSGAPYRLPQKALMTALMRTSGTISVRVDRLVEMGMVRREPDAADRRNVFVALTAPGLECIDTVAPLHLANEDRLLAALSAAEREALAGLLRTALRSFEEPS